MNAVNRPLPCGANALINLLKHGYTPQLAEEYLGIPKNTVQTWYKRGKFKNNEAAVIGKVLFCRPDALERIRDEMDRE